MKILYGGMLGLGSTTEHRLRALRRVSGAEVVAFAYEPFLKTRLPLLPRIRDRLMLSPGITALNRALRAAVNESKPDLVWLDKPVYVQAATVRAFEAVGARTVSYMPDDPFGPRRDGIWRHFQAALSHYWGHVVPREVTRREFLERGARRVAHVPFAFEPSLHFPPDPAASGVTKEFDLIFIGSPHDQRAQWIIRMVRDLPGLKFGLFGPGWRKYSKRLDAVGLTCHPPVWNERYRETIWRSRLALSFITRSNRDELSHKAVESSACGTAALVERSPVHDRVFTHGVSAIFFEDPLRLSETVREALARPAHLDEVGRLAAEAVRRGKLSNDDVLKRALDDLGCESPNAPPGNRATVLQELSA